MVLELLVQAQEVLAACNQMNQAVETYNEAVEACKTAAADLASKWEGQTKEAFVKQQENAYNWHQKMLSVVRDLIEMIRKVIDNHLDNEEYVKKLFI